MSTVDTVYTDQSGRYKITLQGPGSWSLTVNNLHHSSYGTASSARAKASQLEIVRRRRRSVQRHGAVFLASAVVLGLALLGRMAPNPDYPSALEFTTLLESKYRELGSSIQQGIGVDEGGLRGALVEGPPPIELSDGDQSQGTPDPSLVSILTGSHGGVCYTLRWEDPERPAAGVLRSNLDCVPSAEAISVASYSNTSSDWRPGVIDWKPLLPPERIQVSWFMPLVGTLLPIAIWALVGISLAGRRSSVVGPLSW